MHSNVNSKQTFKCRRSNTLKIACLNARSIKNKVSELELYVAEHNYDIIAITETWLNNKDGDECNIEGYTFFRKDRQNRKGGGVAVYAKQDLNVILLQLDDEPHRSEDMWLRLENIRERGLILGVCYRPPNSDSNFNTHLFSNIKKASLQGAMIVMGDFNYPNINWDNLTDGGVQEQEFLEVINDCFLTQHVKAPTQGEACLDLVFCNNQDRIEGVEVIEPLGSSDHNVIQFSVFCKSADAKTKIVKLNFGRANFEQMRQSLSRIHWDKLLSVETVEEQWNRFKNVLHVMQDRYIPKFGINRNLKKTLWWINKDLKKKLQRKKLLYKAYNTNDCKVNCRAYENMRATIKKDIRKAKRQLERNIADKVKEDPKRFL
ncbi:uncharacterized protein LOC127527823 [Erpetoichthys calabaricus]|uniref:uncharacterized protein LOC127527823 n=1 Tax=Erpetoichthys calabaricus TaxID=27687 RepID=UPI0022342497|nr:uncharacterized protein LOC127527823 [Erpetoichthys calabaricus]